MPSTGVEVDGALQDNAHGVKESHSIPGVKRIDLTNCPATKKNAVSMGCYAGSGIPKSQVQSEIPVRVPSWQCTA
jgi:hypothetical protein